jgi:hypothetical protein
MEPSVVKTCQRCYNEKLITQFRKDKRTLDHRADICKKCSPSEKDYNLVLTRVQAIRGRGCIKCPEKDIVCLDFHHWGPKKDIVGNLLAQRRPWEEIREELEKCVVLCSNCHRKLHAGKLKLETYEMHNQKFSDPISPWDIS